MIKIETKWLIIGFLIIVAAVGVWVSIKVYGVRQFNAGYSSAINAVKEQNLRAKGEIDDGIQQIDDCDKRGGVWDATSGVCK